MNYLIRVAYDGSKFNGFQRLHEYDSVQKRLEEALSIIDKEPVLIKGAGRTDRGVHALGQCCSFKLKNNVPPDRLINAINSIVDPYIKVTDCVYADEKFHARHSCKQKIYEYRIYTGNYNPLFYDYYLERNNIDIEQIKDVASLFIGEHNFINFVSGTRDNYDSVIHSIDIKQEKEFIYIRFVGKSFYRYMVRNIVGAMLAYNDGRVTLNDISKLLDSDEKLKCLPTAPANGLYLLKIEY